MVKISVVIITYNAERYLEQCLRSVRNFAGEIVVIDCGSTDKTLAIAKTFGAKIFKNPWPGYAKQKNFGIARATYKWILSLDSDEVLDKILIKNIKKADLNKYDGFYLNRKNLYEGKWIRHCGWYPDWQLRLFKKDKMFFENKVVHEAVQPKGKIGYLKGNILHCSYTNDKEYFDKIETYTDLDAKILYSKKRKWSLIYQFGKPLKEFWQMYVVKKGFLDGWIGLKICLYSAYYRWITIKKLRNLYHAHRD